MKIFAISDLHISTTADKPMDVFGGAWHNYLEKIYADWQEKVSDSDLVLIGGDISWAMSLDNALKDIATFSLLKGKKILIRGNHDYWWKSIGKVRDALPENIIALQNDAVKIDDIIICGSRLWTVPETSGFDEDDLKLYNREIERLTLSLKSAEKLKNKNDKIIALIHFPPFNVKREGSAFTELFEKYGVSAVVYGHLHGKNVRADKLVIKNGIKYYLTSCDQTENKLTEIEL